MGPNPRFYIQQQCSRNGTNDHEEPRSVPLVPIHPHRSENVGPKLQCSLGGAPSVYHDTAVVQEDTAVAPTSTCLVYRVTWYPGGIVRRTSTRFGRVTWCPAPWPGRPDSAGIIFWHTFKQSRPDNTTGTTPQQHKSSPWYDALTSSGIEFKLTKWLLAPRTAAAARKP